MLDLIEKVKLVQAIPATTGTVADVLGDYISMKNAHAVWAILSIDSPTTFIVTPEVAEAYAGTNSTNITGGAKFWVNLNTTQLDRLTASTRSTALGGETANNAMVVVRFDPSAAHSSQTHFAVNVNTTGYVSAVYAIETRYGGYQQTVATTSST